MFQGKLLDSLDTSRYIAMPCLILSQGRSRQLRQVTKSLISHFHLFAIITSVGEGLSLVLGTGLRRRTLLLCQGEASGAFKPWEGASSCFIDFLARLSY